MDIANIIREYDAESNEKRVNDYLKLFTQKYHAFLDNIDLISNERKIALALNKLSSKLEIASYIKHDNKLTREIDILLHSEDTKVRKNIYTVLSHLHVSLDVLTKCYLNENSYINLLHLIGIIAKYENIDIELLRSKLKDIDSSDAYYAKIKNAIDMLDVVEPTKVCLRKLIANDKVLLTTTKIGKSILLHDIFSEDIDILTTTRDGCVIQGDAPLSNVLNIRSFYEMLILPKGKIYINCDIEAIAKCINEFLNLRYFNELFEEKRIKYNYRLEVRGDDMSSNDRQKITKNILSKLLCKDFINIRDNYDFEIRVFVDNKKAMVALKLPYDDKRFAYRVGQLPASIHPVTASIIAGILEPYIAGAEYILDGFVGTGTLLYEVYNRLQYGNYIGVDIENNAIELATDNISSILPNLTLVKSDILEYTPVEKADVIVSNMPFGTRVLRHDAIEELYKGFFAHLHDLLVDDGIACLFTTNGKAIRDALNGTDYVIAREYRVPSGGLTPYLFVIQSK